MKERRNFTVNENERGISMIKPVRLYKEIPDISYEDIREGDLIIAQAVKFITPTIYLKVGEIDGYMSIEDYDYDADGENRIKSVYAHIGKNIIARVIRKEDGVLILERKTVVAETIDCLCQNIGTVVEATIEKITQLGLFVDIGNGITSLLQYREVSRAKTDMENIRLSIGDIVKVRLLEYDPERCFFRISREKAYKILNEKELPQNSCFIVTCHKYVNDALDGVIVEYDPANVGIVDIPIYYQHEEFYPGRKIAVALKAFKGERFKARFVQFV